MSKLASDSPGSEPAHDEPLSSESQELLARVRRLRREHSAPDGARQQALARALAEATRPAVLAMPAPALVRVTRPRARFGVGMLAAAALGVGMLLGTPTLLRTLSARLSPDAAQHPADWSVSGPAGELLKATSPVFRLPLLPLEGAVAPKASTTGARPFSPQDRAWQVRRWNNPKAPPETLAAHSFDRGAVCVTLAPGDRVLGGWPWPAEGGALPPPLQLATGHAYRLSFKAWFKGAIPSQVLLGVGHSQFPFVAAAAARVQVSSEPELFAMDFVAGQNDDSAGVAFLAANVRQTEPARVCFGEMQLHER